jgi:hypothetical protein
MSDADSEQNRRIRDVESRINQLENDVSAILARLDQANNLLKVALIGLAATLGIDFQGMI